VRPDDVGERFERIYGTGPRLFAQAPGRVNLLGEHVDYNQGLALPCAIQFEAGVALSENTSNRIRLTALDLDSEHTLDAADLESDLDRLRATTPDWALYPVGVGWAWVQAGYDLRGWDAAYTCEVPAGSGLSSSAAIEVAFSSAFGLLLGVDLSGPEIAKLCQDAEHGMAGVRSGLMDQWASSSAIKGHALWMDFRSLEARPIPLPDGVAIVVADSGVRRALTASAYNQRVDECRQAVVQLRDALPSVESLRDVPPSAFVELADRLQPPIRQRAQHVVEEIQRVRDGVASLQAGDKTAFGHLMQASHASLRDLYQVSGPELDALAEIGSSLRGGYGTRLTGAGFGGSTVSLVDVDAVDGFCRELSERYRSATGMQAKIWVCQAGDGATAAFV
jgi:galactokinase